MPAQPPCPPYRRFSGNLWLDELRPVQNNISRAHEDCQMVVLGAAAQGRVMLARGTAASAVGPASLSITVVYLDVLHRCDVMH